MIFESTWILTLLILPVAWLAWEWQRTYRCGALVLKTLAFALVVLALAEPRLNVFETKVALTALVDRSGSINEADAALAEEMLSVLRGAQGRHQLQVVPFDETTHFGDSPSHSDISQAPATNLEVAVRNAIGTFPPDLVPRIALITDGKGTSGSIERAAHQARTLGIPVDTFALAGQTPPELRIASISAPAQAFAGESVPIVLEVVTARAGPASVQLMAEGRVIGRSEIQLTAGANVVRARARVQTEGATLLTGSIASPQLGSVQFAHPVTFKRPRALLISGDTQNTETHLREVLGAAGFDVERSVGGIDGLLDPYALIVVNNFDVEAWSRAGKSRVAEFVKAGGGFLFVAGEKNLYVESPEDEGDPLWEMLPASLAPPRTPEGTSVVLVVDKSSSMEGKKMQLARQSAIGVVDNLRPIDRVGVLVFDNSFQWAIPLRTNDEPEVLKQLIAGIIADGGTQIAPALHEAFGQIRETDSVYKHILLLTDGISEEGDSIALAREAAKLQITISTVGLGQDVNRAYLERVASTAEGRSYFLINVAGLEQIVLRDVMEHTGSSIMETSVVPQAVGDAEILEGVALDAAGSLLGWVKFEAKDDAETLLTIGEEEIDPLLLRWQYGLGRAAVFASDAKARWAVNWVGGPAFDRLWTNLSRDLLPRSPATEAIARYESSSDEIVARYRVTDRNAAAIPEMLPDLFVLGPSDFRQSVSLKRVGEQEFEARAPVGNRFGLFRLRPASHVEVFPEIAHYRANSELTDYGSDEGLLQKIATWTGGRFQPDLSAAFDAGGRSIATSMNLWPGLLALALLLSLLELVGRKGWLPWLRRWV
jgi:Ca-activated chloride channel family protein